MTKSSGQENLSMIGFTEYCHGIATGVIGQCKKCNRLYQKRKCRARCEDREFDCYCWYCPRCKDVWFQDEETRIRYEITLL